MEREHIHELVSQMLGDDAPHLTGAVTGVLASSFLGDNPDSLVLFNFDDIPVVGGAGSTTKVIQDILAINAG